MYNTDLPTRAELPSSATLLRSTVIAALVAALLLVVAVLPAEYGIDPTGIGRVLGLTQMGEIKMSLTREAGMRPAAPAAQVAPVTAVPAPAAAVAAPPPVAAAKPEAPRQDILSVKLKPGQAAEVKLAMRKGAQVNYEWTVAGGTVNYDTHGDPVNAPRNFYHGYGKGTNKAQDNGTLQAAFDGTHGWMWRNRSGGEVTVTLKTSGDYRSIDRVL
jgi:hypothetical protein